MLSSWPQILNCHRSKQVPLLLLNRLVVTRCYSVSPFRTWFTPPTSARFKFILQLSLGKLEKALASVYPVICFVHIPALFQLQSGQGILLLQSSFCLYRYEIISVPLGAAYQTDQCIYFLGLLMSLDPFWVLFGLLPVQSPQNTRSRLFLFQFNTIAGSCVIASKSRSLFTSWAWPSTQLKPSNKHRDGCVTHQGVRLERRETDIKNKWSGGINRPYITGPCWCQELRWQPTGTGEKSGSAE